LNTQPISALQLWGGHECTVNRVNDRWFDQTERSGHEHRIDDLALFADLGITKLRYPALWERIAPDHPDRQDFRWTDERLPEIRRLGMMPILTLCHHGSGPHYTSLLDDAGFATGLAHHAAAVARRYPWVEDYTPVNEPLTTARFSALYGFWYPHTRDETAFWRALLNETDATRLAMRAIREVNPAARLIQTDDLGFYHASPPLRTSADFQNARRWMGWDLLCGMVVPGHALWERLVAHGFEARLHAIADDPCPPDVIGVNHYLSSERLLDHRIDLHGGRALADRAIGEMDGVTHVDVDAIRNCPDEVIGIAGLIEQAWARYGIPIAITECHLGTTREEQARWFVDVWREAEGLRARGVDLRAVTAWSLLGAYDWNRMVTRVAGHYEPGIFDVRSGTPAPTLMAGVLRQLAAGEKPGQMGLDVPGWWRAPRADQCFALHPDTPAGERSVLMVRPGDATLTELAVTACEARGLHYVVSDDVAAARTVRPWAVLDTCVGACTVSLAGLCAHLGIGAAVFVRNGGAASADLLAIEIDTIFTADDEASIPVRLLDAFDTGETLPHRQEGMAGAYGPAVIDGVLDLLLDGARGARCFRSVGSLPDLARVLRTVAGYGDDSAPVAGRCGSYLPPFEAMLERFVLDRRRVRAQSLSRKREWETEPYLVAAE
jgi:dTDP-4-dehydrorhamnose reductase